MNATQIDKLVSVIVAALLAIMVLAVPSADAQEEPTPIPEPAQEEPAVEAEPAAAPEPAVAAEPAVEAEPPMAAIPINYRQKTLVTVDGKAQAKGVIELIVQPQGGEPTKVRVNVLAKAKPKAITDDLLKELDFAIDDRYKVSRKADKKILVKVTKKNPPIAITVTTQSLSGVSVTVGNG